MEKQENFLLKEIALELSLPEGFLAKLFEDDDWSLIIKLHSMFEASLTYLLENAIDRKELSDTLHQLPFGDTRYGKIAFVKSLNLLEEKHIKFLETLNTLRNRLVHYVENTNFDLTTDTEQIMKKTMSLPKFIDTIFVQQEIQKEYRNWLFETNPNVMIIYNALGCLSDIYKVKLSSDEIKKIDELGKQLVKKELERKRKD